MKLKIQLGYKVFQIALLFISGLFIASVIFPVLSLLYKPAKARNKRDALKVMWLKWFGLITRLRVRKEGELQSQSCLIVSNHVSWLDIIVLGGFCPAHFVAKSDILAWPVIGFLAKHGDTIFVRRGDKQQAKAITEEMAWLFKQNRTIIAFPEGTTTNGKEVLPFHASLFQSALLTKAIVQPVAIHYLNEAKARAPFIGEDAFVPHLIKMLMLDKVDVRVVFLPAIHTEEKNRQSVSNEARVKIMESVTGEQLDSELTKLKQQGIT
jgi:lyso-ornithine lipid O-acyltransferase